MTFNNLPNHILSLSDDELFDLLPKEVIYHETGESCKMEILKDYKGEDYIGYRLLSQEGKKYEGGGFTGGTIQNAFLYTFSQTSGNRRDMLIVAIQTIYGYEPLLSLPTK